MSLPAFHFKKFSLEQAGAAHPVGTDAVLLGAWANVEGCHRFLDIGTGTGIVALMIAQRIATPFDWKGVGVDIHPASAALARGNFEASPWNKQLDIWEGAIQKFVQLSKSAALSERFDLIISNPPFFSELTLSPIAVRSLGRHTATLSPVDLLESVQKLLAPKGKFCVILPEQEGRRLCELAVPMGLYWTRITEVRSRPSKPVERLLIQFEKSPYTFQKEAMSIYQENPAEGYSAEFKTMTRDFYLAG